VSDSGIPRIRIVRAVRTCLACPSQWEAWTDDERPVHLRYRHGRGTVEIDYDEADYEEPYGFPPEKAGEFTRLAFQGEHGEDGYIELAEFCRLANIDLAPDVKETTPYAR
jgi:hypothetical protein